MIGERPNGKKKRRVFAQKTSIENAGGELAIEVV
jgi:hypothetical protein